MLTVLSSLLYESYLLPAFGLLTVITVLVIILADLYKLPAVCRSPWSIIYCFVAIWVHSQLNYGQHSDMQFWRTICMMAAWVGVAVIFSISHVSLWRYFISIKKNS